MSCTSILLPILPKVCVSNPSLASYCSRHRPSSSWALQLPLGCYQSSGRDAGCQCLGITVAGSPLRHKSHLYLLLEPANSRTSARQKLTRLTRQQFQELSTDVYDELLRRTNNSAENEGEINHYTLLADQTAHNSSPDPFSPFLARARRFPSQAKSGQAEISYTPCLSIQRSL